MPLSEQGLFLCRKLQERLILALMADKTAGGPFQVFLERYSTKDFIPHIKSFIPKIEQGKCSCQIKTCTTTLCHNFVNQIQRPHDVVEPVVLGGRHGVRCCGGPLS